MTADGLVALLTKIIALLVNPSVRSRLENSKTPVSDLIAQLRPELPAKDDGTAWTDAELEAVSATVHSTAFGADALRK